MPNHSLLVIGCGSIGERHLRCFQRAARGAVAGCDNNAELGQRVTATYKVPFESDWQAAVGSGRYTAVVICTPAPSHVPIALKALQQGLHVLIEKPLSHSLAGVAELMQARNSSGSHASVAYVFHQFPVLVGLRDFIRQGTLGPVRQAVAHLGQPFHRLRPAYAGTYYRDRRTGGGAIQDALTHSANWIESILGPTESVLCDCAHLVLPDVEVEDTVHIAARHRDALASYTLNQFQAPNESFLQFNAADGSARAELHRQRWGYFRANDAEWTWHEQPVPDRDAHFLSQANAFLDQIEGRPSNVCSLEAAADTLRFNLASLASAEQGTRVACASLS